MIDAAQRGWGTGVMAPFWGADDEENRRAPRPPGDAWPAHPGRRRRRSARSTTPMSATSSTRSPHRHWSIHYTRHPLWPVEAARYLAEHIADARYVELPMLPAHFGEDTAQNPELAGLIEEHLTGARSEPEPDRVLKTVFFTDIVGLHRAGGRARRPPVERAPRRARRRDSAGAGAVPRRRDQDDGRRVPGRVRRSRTRRSGARRQVAARARRSRVRGSRRPAHRRVRGARRRPRRHRRPHRRAGRGAGGAGRGAGDEHGARSRRRLGHRVRPTAAATSSRACPASGRCSPCKPCNHEAVTPTGGGDVHDWGPLVGDLKARRDRALGMGGPDRVERQHSLGQADRARAARPAPRSGHVGRVRDARRPHGRRPRRPLPRRRRRRHRRRRDRRPAGRRSPRTTSP